MEAESEHGRAFREFAARAHAQLGDSLRRLILYGSVARGEEHADSDIDVLAVIDTPEDKRTLHELAFEVEIEHGIILSVVLRTPEEYRAMKGSRFEEAVNRGVAVV